MSSEKYHQELKIPIISNEGSSINIVKSTEFKIVFISEGFGHIKVNNDIYPIQAPSVLCINNSEEVTLIDGSLKTYTVNFSPMFINSNFKLNNLNERKRLSLVSSDMDMFWLIPFLKRDNNYWGYIKISLNMVPQVIRTLRSIDKEIEEKKDKYWPCRTRSIFMELLFLLNNLQSSPQEDNINNSVFDDDLINKIVIHININYEEPISLNTICDDFAINRTTLNERFKKETGETINQYITSVRIHMACTFLRETYLSITEIMYKTGFNTTANFNKAFKKIINLTPKEYRDKLL